MASTSISMFLMPRSCLPGRSRVLKPETSLPGSRWIDGKFVYPSSGDVINAATKEVVAGLQDELGRRVQSEKLVEVLFSNGKPARTIDPFGVGQIRNSSSK